jgi:hypothetical protein
MIEPYSRPQFEIQGVTFTLKKSSPQNTEKIMEFMREQRDQLMGEDVEDLPEDLEEIQLRRTLELIAEPEDGSLDDIDFRKVDQNKIEYYLQEGFLPV